MLKREASSTDDKPEQSTEEEVLYAGSVVIGCTTTVMTTNIASDIIHTVGKPYPISTVSINTDPGPESLTVTNHDSNKHGQSALTVCDMESNNSPLNISSEIYKPCVLPPISDTYKAYTCNQNSFHYSRKHSQEFTVRSC